MHALRTYLKILLYAMLCTPLVYSIWFSSSYVFVQVHFSQALAALALVPLVYAWIFNAASRPRLNAPRIFMVAFTMGLLLLNLASVDRRLSYTGLWERFGSVFDWFGLLIFFLALITILTTTTQWTRYLRFQILVSTVVACLGLSQAMGLSIIYFDGSRLFSTLGNPAFFGSYILLSMGIGSYLFFQDLRYRWWYLAALFLQGVSLVLTHLRSGLLGAVFALLVFLSVIFYQRMNEHVNSYTRRVFFAICSVIIYAFVVLLVTILISAVSFTHSIRSRDIIDHTAYSRLVNYSIAFNAALAKPLFGWGTGTYSLAFQKYYDPRLYFGADDTTFFDRSHNEFLDRTVENGFIGLCLWILLLASPIWHSIVNIKIKKRSLIALISFLLGYYVYLFFSFTSIADVLLLVTIAALCSLDTPKNADSVTSTRIGFSKALIPAAVIISVCMMLVTQLKPVVANGLVRRGERSSSLAETVSYFKAAWPLGIASQKKIVDDLAGRLHQEPPNDSNLFAYLFLEDALQKLIPNAPYDMRLVVQLARVKRLVSALDPRKLIEAKLLIDTALALSPRDPQLYQARALILLDEAAMSTIDAEKKAFIKGVVLDFTTAYRLAPTVTEAGILYEFGIALASGDYGQLFSYVREHATIFRASHWRLALRIFEYFGQNAYLQKTIELIRTLPQTEAEFILNYPGFNQAQGDLSP